MVIEPSECPKCKKMAGWSKYCGCYVCECGQHFSKSQTLAKCFCGWNLQSGERLPDDIGESRYLGNGEWEVEY